MLDPVTIRVYAALQSLRGNPDFMVVLEYVDAEREKTKELMVDCPADRHQTLQGMARAYGGILKMQREAPDVIRRLNTPDQAA